MEKIELENKENISAEIQQLLQKEFDKYIQNPTSFSNYLETMKKVDQWLENGKEE